MMFSDRYVLEDILGKGVGGVVRRVADSRGNAWAVKIMNSPDDAAMEFSYGKLLKHPCLCSAIDMYVENEKAYIVMELMDVNLHTFVTRRGPLVERDVKIVAQRMAQALAYMHGCGSVHRDVKPANIMLGVEGRFDTVKLGDFGLSEDVAVGTTMVKSKVKGTRGFLAPEMTNAIPGPFGPALDMYALGVTLRFLATGKKTAKTAAGVNWCCSWCCTDDFSDLVDRLTCPDPMERMTSKDMIKHPFLSR